jgi:S-adenosylmethionine:tRNA ribosyltransferase-isomerase
MVMSSLDQVLANFDFHLDKNKIAQAPAIPRDHSKLLLVNRQQNSIKDSIFYQITDYLGDNDVLVLNETKVFPARLLGKKETGGKVELLLLKQLSNNFWEAISKPGLKEGQRLFFLRRESKKALQNGFLELADLEKLEAVVVKREANSAKVEVEFNKSGINLLEEIDACGIMPLPPYIHSKQSENEIRDEYQTVFAKHIGSAAAPTSTRTLEAAVLESQSKEDLVAGARDTNIFIDPPYQFNFVDALITNFHLPQSSLLMLVSALVSHPNTEEKFTNFQDSLLGKAYQHALDNDYRFFSFGDAMFIS